MENKEILLKAELYDLQKMLGALDKENSTLKTFCNKLVELSGFVQEVEGQLDIDKFLSFLEEKFEPEGQE